MQGILFALLGFGCQKMHFMFQDGLSKNSYNWEIFIKFISDYFF